jgi:hypothetical protein
MRTLKELLGNDFLGYFTRSYTIEKLMAKIILGHQKLVGIESIKIVNEDRMSLIFNTRKDGLDNKVYNLLDVIMGEPTWEQMMDIKFGVGHKCDMRIVLYDKESGVFDIISNRCTAFDFASLYNSCGVITYLLGAEINSFNQPDELGIGYDIDAHPDIESVTPYQKLPSRIDFEEAEFWHRFGDYSYPSQESFTNPAEVGFRPFVVYHVNNVTDVIPVWKEGGFFVKITTNNFQGHQKLLSLLRSKRREIEEHYSKKHIEIQRIPDTPIKIKVKIDDRPFSEFESMSIWEKNECAKSYREIVFEFRDFFEGLINGLPEIDQRDKAQINPE